MRRHELFVVQRQCKNSLLRQIYTPKRLLRSIISILIGWFTAFSCTAVTLIVLALFNQNTFRPGIDLPTRWLVTILAISSTYGVLGGYVTAVISARAEMLHGALLAVLSFAVAIYFLYFTENSTPHWYRLLGLVLVIPTTILGAWIRIKHYEKQAAN